MKTINRKELDQLAAKWGFSVHAECGGFRIIRDIEPNDADKDTFPNDGICLTASKKECYIFLLGFEAGVKRLSWSIITSKN